MSIDALLPVAVPSMKSSFDFDWGLLKFVEVCIPCLSSWMFGKYLGVLPILDKLLL